MGRVKLIVGFAGVAIVALWVGLAGLATQTAPAAAAVLQTVQGGQVGALGGVVAAAPSATGIFIRAEGVDGESQDKDHKNWSDLTSVSQPLHRSVPQGATGMTRTRGGASVSDIQVVKRLDKASPKYAELLLLGRVIPRVEIDMVGSFAFDDRKSYYRYELRNVLVTSYELRADVGSVPVDSFSLNFEEMKVTYVELGSDGVPLATVAYTHRVN